MYVCRGRDWFARCLATWLPGCMTDYLIVGRQPVATWCTHKMRTVIDCMTFWTFACRPAGLPSCFASSKSHTLNRRPVSLLAWRAFRSSPLCRFCFRLPILPTGSRLHCLTRRLTTCRCWLKRWLTWVIKRPKCQHTLMCVCNTSEKQKVKVKGKLTETMNMQNNETEKIRLKLTKWKNHQNSSGVIL